MDEVELIAAKETDNKLRWDTDIDGAPFELYVPKWRVPRPWPGRVYVRVFSGKSPDDVLRDTHIRDVTQTTQRPIVAELQLTSKHQLTVRYTPLGDNQAWQIGEPYIPYQLLPPLIPDSVVIRVRWDLTSPWACSA